MVCQPLQMIARHGQFGFARRPASCAWAALTVLGSGAGCTCQSDDHAKPLASAPLEWACRPDSDHNRGSIRASGSPAASDDGPALFAVELGRATRGDLGLIVPYLDHDGKEQRARAYIQGPKGQSRTVDLGTVHGDAAPPQVTATNAAIYFAIRDSAAAGENYRIAKLGRDSDEPTFSSDIAGGLDRSPGFDVAAHPGAAVVVWDDWDSSEARGVIRAARVGPSLGEPDLERLSPVTVDAEAPRVVATQSGYSVAWVALGQPKRAAGGASADGNEPVLKVTERWIQVLRLDAQGAPQGGPIDVTSPDGFVVGFDMVTGHGDFLLFALRDDDSTPGVSGGSIRTAGVSPGGGTSERVVVESDVGGGLPSLAFDPDPKDGAPHGWLAYSKSDGDTRLLALAPDGAAIDLSGSHLDLSEDTLLDARSGRVTLGRPRGRDVLIERMICGPRERPAAPVLPPQEITE